MIKALFTSDLHGSIPKYEFLFEQLIKQKPAAVFITGDLTGISANSSLSAGIHNFLSDYLGANLQKIKNKMKQDFPQIFVILGNDDPKSQESVLRKLSDKNLLNYINEKIVKFQNFRIAGYSYVPPTPFMNKDWEKYDVSRYVDVGCISPEQGYRSIEVGKHELRYNTIKRDLDRLFKDDLSRTVFLFHSPPYQTDLDRADLDRIFVDHAPVDVHVGSIAIKEFILNRSPYLTLHGHIHESTRITGNWMQKIGNTFCFQGALERNDIGLIKLDLDHPENAEMIMLD
ncbi:MAG: metallophosphoesterase [Candidatus Cloacimonetes bacterium]|nr:metallophosphoesterase [Candidatus Cloacimonadota bacterium]MCF7812922.1 metallophosphoesterase [Candidatus Cloacimonadota bacterium]MCF7867134.1 metallophosphoesterase [Candidatus Cloacimonadota bacterium]MCF7882546.1 metallophosphoesterase [Candidatus Cloacimonadota bacterium]